MAAEFYNFNREDRARFHEMRQTMAQPAQQAAQSAQPVQLASPQNEIPAGLPGLSPGEFAAGVARSIAPGGLSFAEGAKKVEEYGAQFPQYKKTVDKLFAKAIESGASPLVEAMRRGRQLAKLDPEKADTILTSLAQSKPELASAIYGEMVAERDRLENPPELIANKEELIGFALGGDLPKGKQVPELFRQDLPPDASPKQLRDHIAKQVILKL